MCVCVCAHTHTHVHACGHSTTDMSCACVAAGHTVLIPHLSSNKYSHVTGVLTADSITHAEAVARAVQKLLSSILDHPMPLPGQDNAQPGLLVLQCSWRSHKSN
eukprot:scpid107745/ scgid33640/ 